MKMLDDRVLIKVLEKENMVNGVILAGFGNERAFSEAEVVHVGDKCEYVSVGDVVVIPTGASKATYHHEDEKHSIISESNIVAIL